VAHIRIIIVYDDFVLFSLSFFLFSVIDYQLFFFLK